MERKPLYGINQCALYKMESKSRLAKLLRVSVRAMLSMAKSRKYREFWLEEEICPFTGKITKRRYVQTPADALRPIHDRLHDLLRRVSPPQYAHAAVKGKSYRSNAETHKNSPFAATFDLSSFYPSTSEEAVFRFFAQQLNCAHDIANLLAKLICVVGPSGTACLPTGSPLSPLISIYANKPMFDALDQLAQKEALTFTCYVDDLTFSGAAISGGLEKIVSSIVRRHGHTLSAKKTRTFGLQSAKHITGVVVQNGKVAVPNSRFHKARKIQGAIGETTDRVTRIQLMQKLSGLLGEAAFLDPRYKPWARRSYRTLSDYRASAPVITEPPVELTELSIVIGIDAADGSPPF